MSISLLNLEFFKNYRLLLRPRLLLPSIRANNILSLRKKIPNNIKGLIFDLDQTIAPYGESEIDQKYIQELINLKRTYKCCILSNFPQTDEKLIRVNKIKEILDIEIIYSDKKKPDLSPFSKALEYLGYPSYQVLMIGDRVFTDILGGNNANILTVLVDPIEPSSDPFFWVRVPRIIENIIVYVLSKIL